VKYRFMNELEAVRGYKALRKIAGRPSFIAPNHLQNQFTVAETSKVWVADITYIRTGKAGFASRSWSISMPVRWWVGP
jgi:transposase InsO family protein